MNNAEDNTNVECISLNSIKASGDSKLDVSVAEDLENCHRSSLENLDNGKTNNL